MGEFLHGVIQILGLLSIWIGVIFCILAILGLYRLPDVYARLHASAKVSTMGLAGLLLGTALILPASALKAIALTIFIVITGPVSSHAIAVAAYRLGVPIIHPSGQPARDDMKPQSERFVGAHAEMVEEGYK